MKPQHSFGLLDEPDDKFNSTVVLKKGAILKSTQNSPPNVRPPIFYILYRSRAPLVASRGATAET